MLNTVIRFALQQRVLVVAVSLFLLGYGGWRASRLEIDVFPNLDRPRVVVMTEAPGMAPEEVEALITFPLESALNGAHGVEAVRSSSGVGLSVIYVEFEWGTDIYDDRQIVAERLPLVAERLPPGIQPQLAPISSVMGQIVMIGMRSEGGKTGPLELRTLADWVVRQRLLTIPGVSQVFTMGGGRKQFQVLVNPDSMRSYGVSLRDVKRAVEGANQNATGGYLDEQGPNEFLVRSLGRVETVEDLQKLVVTLRNGRPVTLRQVARVVEGPQVKRGDSSAFVRVESRESKSESGKPKAESRKRGKNDTARGRRGEGAKGMETPIVGSFAPSPRPRVPASPPADSQPSTLNSQPSSNSFAGGPAVLLTVNKQPDADTRHVTDEVLKALEDLKLSLPDDIRIHPELYSQKAFIDRAIDNVIDALRDGGILVVVVLFLFLLNFRTTFITLTAIPLSLVITAMIFTALGLSINTMTLGGLAVAIGELVDDAIVDVENIFRRLRENRQRSDPRHPLLVVYQASVEIRNSIVFGTIIVVLVFVPLFALTGMEGRLFTPLGIAYIVSILASLLVSLTLTPVLSYWLLSKAPIMRREADAFLLRFLKWVAAGAIRLSLRHSKSVLLVAVVCVGVSASALRGLERDFLPPFNEGTVLLMVVLPSGTSLKKSTEIAVTVERRLQEIDAVLGFTRRTGRAELDEHAEGVNVNEFLINLDPHSGLSREKLLLEIREAMTEIPGIVVTAGQPITHLISHMLSGVKAQVGIKLFGDDLDVLRGKAAEMQRAIESVPGVTDLMVEPQVVIPQLRIELDRDKLQTYGLTPVYVNEYVETAMNGQVVSQVLLGQRTFDLLVRMDEPFRENRQAVSRLAIDLPAGRTAVDGATDGPAVPLSAIARIYESGGPNTINREQVRRRIILQCNVTDRGLVDVVQDIQEQLAEIELPRGYFIEYGGQFERQQTAVRVISVLFAVSLLAVFLVLYTMFRSVNFSLQVMAALPTAFIGSVAALVFTGQTLTVASMVGFISLAGIASRNGILLLNHYLHLVRYEGETWSREMILRAGQERLAPVLMTALTSGIGLIPLALAAGEPGKEILYPIATVIIGGLLSSTLLEFFVRPALFWTFGRKAGERLINRTRKQVQLIEKTEESKVESPEPA